MSEPILYTHDDITLSIAGWANLLDMNAGYLGQRLKKFTFEEAINIKKIKKSERGKNHHKFTGYEDISGNFWNKIRYGAKSREIDFNITPKYAWEVFIKQNRKCIYSNIELVFIKTRTEYRISTKEHTASLDRINSDIGYVEGNIQWVHKYINCMKLDHTSEEFIQWCKLVANNNPAY